MWNQSKSLRLSIFCTRLFLALLVAVVIGAPWIVRWYFGVELADRLMAQLCAAVYVSAVPCAALLYCLHRLLRNIYRQEVFISLNVLLLRVISWCCIAAGIVMLVSSTFYQSFLLVSVAAAFCGLIVRVVKNVFEQALELKEENDATI